MQSLVALDMHYIKNADGTEELYALSDVMESRDLATDPASRDVLVRLRGQLESLTRAGAR